MLDVSLPALAMMVQIITNLMVAEQLNYNGYIDTNDEVYCLAINSYHEARGEGFDDKLATAQVVMNRVASERYPDDVCDVITDGPTRESWKTRQHTDLDILDRVYYPIRHRCQFSWYCDGRSDVIHNHAHDRVTPSWADSMEVTVKLRGHTYLKEN